MRPMMTLAAVGGVALIDHVWPTAICGGWAGASDGHSAAQRAAAKPSQRRRAALSGS
jgi:hypothetical protein